MRNLCDSLDYFALPESTFFDVVGNGYFWNSESLHKLKFQVSRGRLESQPLTNLHFPVKLEQEMLLTLREHNYTPKSRLFGSMLLLLLLVILVLVLTPGTGHYWPVILKGSIDQPVRFHCRHFYQDHRRRLPR